MCGGFHGILVGMLPGTRPKNSCPGFQREDLLPHTTESYGEQPKWWLINIIKSFSICLFSHTQCHFILILWSQGDSSRFSHHIKLQKKPVSFLVFHLISEENFSPKSSSNLLFTFHWPKLGLVPSSNQFLARGIQPHHRLRLIRICQSYSGEEEKTSEPLQRSAGVEQEELLGIHPTVHATLTFNSRGIYTGLLVGSC